VKPTTVEEIPRTGYPGRPQRPGTEDERLARELPGAFRALGDRTVWHVNSTAAGGGVAELLYGYLRRHNRAGVPTRWLVADASDEFFAITKGLFYRLYSHPADTPALTADDFRLYAGVTARHADLAIGHIRPGDVVILHDQQTAGMAPRLAAAGAVVVWQCHLGSVVPTRRQDEAWDFLEPFFGALAAVIFSTPAYPPARLADRSHIIMPAIDEYSAKNRPLDPGTVHAILADVGLTPPAGTARDAVTGRPPGWAADLTALTQTAPVPPDAPVLLQVSRWDQTKGVLGVLESFVTILADARPEPHLVLLGPDPAAVADDPGAQEIFDAALRQVTAAPPGARDRVHLVRTAGTDLEGTAFIVNAVQRWAQVISQKSLCEGFGLTVTEGKWKRKPVVAAEVGGIPLQLRHGETGLLVPDSHDLAAFADTVSTLLDDEKLRTGLGDWAHDDVAERFLLTRQLRDYLRLYETVLP
jgi:trehalose synthase